MFSGKFRSRGGQFRFTTLSEQHEVVVAMMKPRPHALTLRTGIWSLGR